MVPLVLLVSCDSADSRTTAQVDAVRDGTACLIPEDPEQEHLRDCYPLSPGDATRFKAGDCVEVRIPYDAPRRPLYDLEVLKRECHVGRAAGTNALTEALSFVGFLAFLGCIGLVLVLIGRRVGRRPPAVPS